MALFTYTLGTPVFPSYDYNPFFDALVDFRTATEGAKSATLLNMTLANGLKIQIAGSGFTYDSGNEFVGGTISSIKVFKADGITQVMSWMNMSVAAGTFSDIAGFFSPYDLTAWIGRNNDTINGGAGDDDLFGFDGNDIINGGGGSDFIDGGRGDDTYSGGDGYDQLSFATTFGDPLAFRGIDLNATTGTVIDPYGNSETFTSFESFRGSSFGDRIVGSGADEEFMGLGGSDYMDGGGGFDMVRYHRDDRSGGLGGVTVNLTTGIAIDGFGRRDTLVSIEGARGTEKNDTLIGSSVHNVLIGGGGNDYLDGGLGADTLRGGAGNDTYIIDNAGDVVQENPDGNLGVDTVRASISINLASTAMFNGTVENLILLGSTAINGIGNAANNVITGNDAANTLMGQDGIDTLNGVGGSDTLYGGNGNDVLTGGLGADFFVFNTALNASTNVDRITDFTVVDDTIRLENAIFTALTTAGTLNAAFFVKNTTGLAGDADDRIIYETDTGKLYYDSNGSAAGGAIHFATLAPNLTTLTAADFVVI